MQPKPGFLGFPKPANPLLGPGLIKLAEGEALNVASIDIALMAYNAWRDKLLVVSSLIPQNDGASLYARTSSDGGSSFDAGGSDYGYQSLGSGATSASFIELIPSIGNGAGEGAALAIELFHTTNPAVYTKLLARNIVSSSTVTTVVSIVGALRAAAQNTDAIRLLSSSGNIASAFWSLYGFN